MPNTLWQINLPSSILSAIHQVEKHWHSQENSNWVRSFWNVTAKTVVSGVVNWCSGLTSRLGLWLGGGAEGSIPRSAFVFCSGENVCVHSLCMDVGVRTALLASTQLSSVTEGELVKSSPWNHPFRPCYHWVPYDTRFLSTLSHWNFLVLYILISSFRFCPVVSRAVHVLVQQKKGKKKKKEEKKKEGEKKKKKTVVSTTTHEWYSDGNTLNLALIG